MTRLAKGSIVIRHNGKPMTLRQLAAATGIAYYTLSWRYQAGDRGEDLIRPPGAPSKRKPAAPKVVARKDPGPFRHVAKRKPNSARVQAERDARQRAMAGLIAAFSGPLISADLLSDEERLEARRNVVGRQRWYPLDGAQR